MPEAMLPPDITRRIALIAAVPVWFPIPSVRPQYAVDECCTPSHENIFCNVAEDGEYTVMFQFDDLPAALPRRRLASVDILIEIDVVLAAAAENMGEYCTIPV